MSLEKKEEKSRLHPRNKNRERYDLSALVTAIPELGNYVKPNKYGNDSVDFSNPEAVKLLNKALLHHYYGIENWDFPKENLTPPIPGRADYLHYIADLLTESYTEKIPMGKKVTCLDIGIGASCIYPIIGVREYGWNFIGSDTDQKAIDSARNIVSSNPSLTGKIECRLQENPNDIFHGIINPGEKIDIVICNPPFHASADDASKGTQRKVRNLSGKKDKKPEMNFGGISSELIYEGGEQTFIQNMLRGSKYFSKNVYWFSTLVSKQSTLKSIYRALEKLKVTHVKTINLGTSNKSSRIVAWTFLGKTEQYEWVTKQWNSGK
ncbi:23S rRNA (adenine(1618)-N(6))-methyltransferase RlmF [Cryomorpha ignava]|nr:23S rRNA (adenine(1618)-N(6))-methyltransferase RlmF [Cryomorpha ignava]